MSSRESAKYKDCSTTAWICLEEENHNHVLDVQLQLRKQKKRCNIDETVNYIIGEHKKLTEK